MAGTKPQALHTEYAKEGASFNGGFYGPGNDIVFYLMRADQGDGGMESGELPTSEDSMYKAMANSGFDGIQPQPGGDASDDFLFGAANGSIDIG